MACFPEATAMSRIIGCFITKMTGVAALDMDDYKEAGNVWGKRNGLTEQWPSVYVTIIKR